MLPQAQEGGDGAAPALDVRGLTKQFGSNLALRGVDLWIESGEFVGLMGPNGAGKSTLLKILDGVYSRTSGTVSFFGRLVDSLSDEAEVGFIHQDLGLVESMSVLENLRLGEAPKTRWGLLDRSAEERHAREALRSVGVEVPLQVPVASLAPGEKTLVAVARSLSRGARLLFVDEATSTLPPPDARRVISALKRVTHEGCTVVMISHKLSEILDATDRVVVLLDGAVASDRSTRGLDRKGLVELLVQRDSVRPDEGPCNGDEGSVLLSMRGAHGGRAGPVNFDVRVGEVVGITGLPGSGLHDVAHLAFGTLKPTRGSVTYGAKKVRRALVPAHRESEGGFDELSVRENMTISSLSRWRRTSRLLTLSRETGAAAVLADQMSIRPRGLENRYGRLSGGNKQKAIIARGVLNKAQIIIFCEPTRGVDVRTRSEIYELMRSLRDDGVGLLIVTSDAEDLFAVAQRIGVITDGSVQALQSWEDISAEELESMF